MTYDKWYIYMCVRKDIYIIRIYLYKDIFKDIYKDIFI